MRLLAIIVLFCVICALNAAISVGINTEHPGKMIIIHFVLRS